MGGADAGAPPVGEGARGRSERVAFWTPWGDGFIDLEDGLPVQVIPPWDVPESARVSDISLPAPHALGASARMWGDRFDAYFRRETGNIAPDDVSFDHLRLGRFTVDVYQALLTTRPGAVVTYGELARLAGYPRAARAVGTAMARNPLPLLVPCHRVIRSDGTLGHYGTSPHWKEVLLRFEGAL